uniref:Neurotransmitter-gated ion-channel transmembrane domain-containing protein n=1 Tax=Acrobeloides nanus TaxID=290746 RepID=A0A914DC86_9BILA
MDHQACNIRILSYAYIAKEVNVTWFKRGAVRHNSEIDLPEYSIKNITAEYCDGTYVYAITKNSYKKDQFSCLEGKLFLRRSIGYHLVQSYIPTGLIVIISWVSFWIDRRAVPARVTLSFTTLLSLSTLVSL